MRNPIQSINRQNDVARAAAQGVLLEVIESDPAKFGRMLMEHPSYLLDVCDAHLLDEAIEAMQNAGLNDTLWRISCSVNGYRPARMYIREKVFSGLN